MIAVLTLLTVIVLSMLTVKVAATALVLTGLSRPLARFQARSAFTGTGFTTSESEKIVGHPVRRKIVMLLMLLGNAGLVTSISTLMLSFLQGDETALWKRAVLLLSGLVLLWAFASSRWIDRRLSRLVAWALKRWTSVDARDYAGLLHLQEDYVVVEFAVEAKSWLAGKPLERLRLNEEGVLVLGVETATGAYVGAPRGQTTLHAGDTLVLYGTRSQIDRLDRRALGFEGNRDHVDAVADARRRRLAEEARQVAEETRRDGSPLASPPYDADADQEKRSRPTGAENAARTESRE